MNPQNHRRPEYVLTYGRQGSSGVGESFVAPTLADAVTLARTRLGITPAQAHRLITRGGIKRPNDGVDYVRVYPLHGRLEPARTHGRVTQS